jgi:hypothetical protein
VNTHLLSATQVDYEAIPNASHYASSNVGVDRSPTPVPCLYFGPCAALSSTVVLLLVLGAIHYSCGAKVDTTHNSELFALADSVAGAAVQFSVLAAATWGCRLLLNKMDFNHVVPTIATVIGVAFVVPGTGIATSVLFVCCWERADLLSYFLQFAYYFIPLVALFVVLMLVGIYSTYEQKAASQTNIAF